MQNYDQTLRINDHRRMDVINWRRVLNILSQNAFITKLDGIVKMIRIEPRSKVLELHPLRLFTLPSLIIMRAIAFIFQSNLSSVRSNLTSIKLTARRRQHELNHNADPYQFSVQLMTKRQRRPPAGPDRL